MAPIAIGLSVYLLRHPSFTAILDMENDFGIVLGVLLGAIIITSLVWLVCGDYIRNLAKTQAEYDKFKEYKIRTGICRLAAYNL